jgi:hypothetical protein
MSIPVISAAIVNEPYWLYRLIASIDYPTDNLVIVNNNGKGEITQELDNMTKITHKFIKKITVCHLPANIGLAGAWNLTIKCYMNSPWWIFVNHDISFSLGLLKELAEAAEKDKEAGMVFGHGGDFGDGSYDVMLIKDWVIQTHGLFDENFYPAYCEDIDYIMRIKTQPIKQIMLGKSYFHGLGTNYYETGENTKKSDPLLKEKLEHINKVNIDYLDSKWGPGWRTSTPYPHPFNNVNIPMTFIHYNLGFVRTKHLGF